jgi:hypothetical protein
MKDILFYDLRLRPIRSNGKFCAAELHTAPAAHVPIANAYESALEMQYKYK